MPSLLNDIVVRVAGPIAARIASIMGDEAAAERSVDAAAPAVLAGLASTNPETVFAAVAGVTAEMDDPDALEAAGHAVAEVAFGDGRDAVSEHIAGYLEAEPEPIQRVVDVLAGVSALVLAERASEQNLDSGALAQLLAAERAALDGVGVGDMLAAWGLGGGSPEAVESGFAHDPNVGRPAALWWLTGLVTVVLFAIAVAQCHVGPTAATAPSVPASAVATVATAPPATVSQETPSALIGDVLVSDDRFSQLAAAVDSAGLTPMLDGSGPLTVFAPTDDAFAKLGDGLLEELVADQNLLEQVLLAHVVEGAISSSDLLSGGSFESLSGHELAIEVAGRTVRVAGATIIEADIAAANGVIHAIDELIVPAFVTLPGAGASNVIEAMRASGDFSILLAALDSAGLTDTLSAGGPLTVFGPNDAAFTALPPGTIEALLERPADLTQVLTFHVVEGALRSTDLTPGTELTTLQGDVLPVEDAEGTLVVGRARILTPDIEAGNGVLHVTDAVLLPATVFPSGEPTINYVLALEPITFATASAEITPEGQAELLRVADYLQQNPVSVEIQGHTDSDGPEDANQVLSEARANAVLQFLVDNGVDPALLTALGFGETQPVADNDTPEGKAQNRRIEFRVIG